MIEKAITAPNEMGLTYVPDFSLFEHIRVYVRRFTTISRECRNLTTRFRKRRVSMDAYQRMVVALKFKAGKNLGPLARSDVVYLRLFKDVPHVDMEMHLPEQGTKVRMRNIDKAQIASPLAIAIPTLIAKVMFASLVSPFAFGGLLAAPISAGLNSFFGFQREAEASVLDDLSPLLSDAGEQCVGFDPHWSTRPKTKNIRRRCSPIFSSGGKRQGRPRGMSRGSTTTLSSSSRKRPACRSISRLPTLSVNSCGWA